MNIVVRVALFVHMASGLRQGDVAGQHTKTKLKSAQPLPVMANHEFLIAASPSLGKVVYTDLQDFEASRMYVLMDKESGLVAPCGISVDSTGQYLFIADRAQRQIIRVGLNLIREAGGAVSMVYDYQPFTIVQDQDVEWIAVDSHDNLYYSNSKTNAIYMVPYSVISAITVSSTMDSSQLRIVSGPVVAMQQAASAAAGLRETLPTDAPKTQPQIYEMFFNDSHLSQPSGMAIVGGKLYWANSVNYTGAGSIVEASAQPTLPSNGALKFPTTMLYNQTNASYGVAATSDMVVWTVQGENEGYVYGSYSSLSGFAPYKFVSELTTPRGLVWDGDQTMFVADAGAGVVYSFPVGELTPNQPTSTAVTMDGVFGLAFLTTEQVETLPTPGTPASAMKQPNTSNSVLQLSSTNRQQVDYWSI